jgi:hypothetical protein
MPTVGWEPCCVEDSRASANENMSTSHDCEASGAPGPRVWRTGNRSVSRSSALWQTPDT